MFILFFLRNNKKIKIPLWHLIYSFEKIWIEEKIHFMKIFKKQKITQKTLLWPGKL